MIPNSKFHSIRQKLLLTGLSVVGVAILNATTIAADSRGSVAQVKHISLDAMCQSRNATSLEDLLGEGGSGKVTTIEALTQIRDKITDLVLEFDVEESVVVGGKAEGEGMKWEPLKLEVLFGPPPPESDDDEAEVLSAGEQKRKPIAPAEINDPEVEPFDEPTPDTLSDIEETISELRDLQEFRSSAQEGVKTITDRAKEDPSEDNRRDAALARKSNQTFNYQRAVIDAYIRELIGLQRELDEQETPISFGDEEPQLPETNEEAWAKNRRTTAAQIALIRWEQVRKETE